jgi:hypothetical protein
MLSKHENKKSKQSTPTLSSKQQSLPKPTIDTLPKADFTNSNFDILFAKPDGYTGATVADPSQSRMILHKVEFSDKNTRAYLTVENLNGKTGISFYDFDSKAIQGNRQFATAYSFDVTYPAIKSDIPPRIR